MQHVTSALPTSFDGNGILFAAALTSLMCMACLGLAVVGWMARDTWRDRYYVHPLSLVFTFRVIFGLIASNVFIRCAPEVLYLQVYGEPDVSENLVRVITIAKRFADTISLGFFSAWLILFVAIYPHVILALKSGPVKLVRIDIPSIWPRLLRPAAVFLLILSVSCLTAYAKVYGAR